MNMLHYPNNQLEYIYNILDFMEREHTVFKKIGNVTRNEGTSYHMMHGKRIKAHFSATVL
jgi:hypothetical protein